MGKETNAPTEQTVDGPYFDDIDGGQLIGNVNNTFRDFQPNDQ